MRDDYTHISIVLDQSGTMASILHETIAGYNKFLTAQQLEPGHATITLRTFSNSPHESWCEFWPVKTAPFLGIDNYVPGGMTALYDAVGLTIKETGERLRSLLPDQRPARVIFVIITDGQENHSRVYNYAQIAEMIAHQTHTYKWEFIFLAANQDAMKIADSMNIDRGKTMTFGANSVGTVSAYHSLADKIRSYRTGEAQGCSFDDADREAQTAAGVDPRLNNAAGD